MVRIHTHTFEHRWSAWWRVPANRIMVVLALGVIAFNFKPMVWANLVPKRFGVVVPGAIYRSGKLTPAALAHVMTNHHIKTVIDLGAWVEETPANARANRREQRTVEALGGQRYVFHLIGDATGDPNEYVQALALMLDASNHPVLVHCGAGTERTGCVVALYQMHEQGKTIDEVMEQAKRAGHNESRNPRLRRMLRMWSEPILHSLETGEPIPWHEVVEP